MLSVQGLNVSIAGTPILRDLALTLPPAKTTVLVGRNGAGKTTTLRAIMGLLKISSGDVSLEGAPLSERPAHCRAALGMGYAPEDRRLIAGFSVEQNIVLGAEATKLGATESDRRLEEIYDLLPQLRSMADRPAGSVSGGQGKMVALARALMVAEKVLLLDEPFQGLAPALALEYAQALGRLRTARPEVAFLITESSPDLLASLADRTLRIERGAIVQSEGPAPS